MHATVTPLQPPEGGVELWELTENNRRELFRESIASFEANAATYNRSKSNLERMNPEVAKHFEAKPDQISKAPFRVVMPKNTAQSRKVNGYVILSWSWHGDWEKATIHPPVEPWPFPQDVVNSILDLRVENEDWLEGIWIDKICIRQEDEKDKKLQIGCMDIIYQNATRMVIVMEDVKLTRDVAETLKRFNGIIQNNMQHDISAWPDTSTEVGGNANAMSDYLHREFSPTPDDVEHLKCAFKLITASRWFTRAWCVHEGRLAGPFRFAQQPRFRVYDQFGNVVRFNLTTLVLIFHMFCRDALDEKSPDFLRAMMAGNMFSGGSAMPSPERPRHGSLMWNYCLMESAGCFFQCDRISIALNISRAGLVYVGPEMNKDTCLFVTSLASLAIGEVSPLIMRESPVVLQKSVDAPQKIRKVLSWLRRPDSVYVDMPQDATAPTRNNERQYLSATEDYVVLDVIRLPNPEKHIPTGKTLNFMKEIVTRPELRSLINELGFPIDNTESLIDESIETSLPTQVHFRVLGISFCVEQSIDWFISMNSLFERLVTFDPYVFQALDPPQSAKEALWWLAEHMMSHIQERDNINEAAMRTTLPALLKVLYVLVNSYYHGRPANLSLTTNEGHFNSLFGVKKDWPQDHVLAVPKLLADRPDYTNRVFVLQPLPESTSAGSSGTRSWRIVDKVPVLAPGGQILSGSSNAEKEFENTIHKLYGGIYHDDVEVMGTWGVRGDTAGEEIATKAAECGRAYGEAGDNVPRALYQRVAPANAMT